MKDSIIEKIKLHVGKGMQTEADCVYLLSQSRKFMEQQDIKGFWNLRMCANWALHSTLDNERNPTVSAFLEEVNDFLVDAKIRNGYDLERLPSLKDKFMFVVALQNELKTFLEYLGIETSICDDPKKLANLINIFGKVIEDTPLVCKASKPLSHFNEISFSKRKTIVDPHPWPATLYWTIKKKDNMTLHINIRNKTLKMGIAELDLQTFVYIENKSN
jgi:hypothetical protein